MMPPVLIDPLTEGSSGTSSSSSSSASPSSSSASSSSSLPRGAGWSEGLESELLGVAALLRRSDVETYIGWARNVVKINKALAIAAPALAGAAALLNAAQPMLASPPFNLGLAAALCSSMAALAGSFSNDMQLGMVAELYRNSAGYYSDIAGSIHEALDSPVAEREHGQLFRQRIAYQLGRSPAASSLLAPDDAAAGTLF
jgi:hypothetical protein